MNGTLTLPGGDMNVVRIRERLSLLGVKDSSDIIGAIRSMPEPDQAEALAVVEVCFLVFHVWSVFIATFDFHHL